MNERRSGLPISQAEVWKNQPKATDNVVHRLVDLKVEDF